MNKDKILLIAGCSHTSGSEIDGSEDSKYNRKHSFGGVLATQLNRRSINIAQVAMSNSGIARSVMNWFKRQYNHISMDVAVLIAWTESTRMENIRIQPAYYQSSAMSCDWFDNTSNDYYRINMGFFGGPGEDKEMFKFFHEYMARFPELAEITNANYVIQVQNYLKLLNVPYLMCNAMHMFSNPPCRHLKQYLDFIDTDRYYKMMDNSNSFYTKYKNLGYTNEKAKYWHHGEEPHRAYADELYKFIGDNHVFS